VSIKNPVIASAARQSIAVSIATFIATLLLCGLLSFSQPSAASSQDAQANLLRTFLHCDAQFFKLPSHSAAGVKRLTVSDRRNEEGQSLVLAPPFTVQGVAFNEFIDEVTRFDSREHAAYYWGFNTDAPLAQVLPVVQALLDKKHPLTADGNTWARIDVFERGVWHNIPNHASLKGKPATRPERALIVETHEGGGTRVICGLQAAPVPASELKKLRPDL
jgi:hypothetical protein